MMGQMAATTTAEMGKAAVAKAAVEENPELSLVRYRRQCNYLFFHGMVRTVVMKMLADTKMLIIVGKWDSHPPQLEMFLNPVESC